jgi:hypothetical protein
MNRKLSIWLLALVLAGVEAFAARPQVVMGPGTGGGSFRVPWHQTYNRTLYNDTTYILTGWYFVDSTYSLTIQRGTIIRGDSASGGTLIVRRGAQIFAAGTRNQPIIFTSNKPNNRVPGDWGGVIILGNATTNQPSTQQIEGGFSTIPGAAAMYGGPDPNDNSGVLQYVRIEFAGIAFAQDNEINGLTFGGVGAGTTVDHIQVSYANDDDYEFFGGTVRAKYLVGWRSIDDCFDTDFGFSGSLQFMYTKRDPNLFDASASGSSNGEESDNEGTAPYDHLPRTKARFSNWTLVGPLADTSSLASLNTHWGYVGFLRRATELSIYNSIMMGWANGIMLRDTLTQRAAIDGRLELHNISLQAPRNILALSSSPSTGNIPGFSFPTWFATSGWGNMGGTPRQTSDIGLPGAVWNLDASNNPVPSPTSEPATAGTAYDGRLSGDAWYTNVSYRGAFDPSLPLDQQWTAGWTNFAPETYDPEAATVAGSVASGWDLISNPVVGPVPGDSVRQLFPTSLNNYAFAFSGGYVSQFRLLNGVGYWEKFPSATTVQFNGTALNRVSIPVAAGWNMVGSISTAVDTSTIVSVPAGLRASNWFGYAGGYTPVAQLVPGKGYWVKSFAAGEFVLANPPSAAKIQNGSNVLATMNSITVTDARGNSQTLYFGADAQKKVPVEMYALPPMPPTGAFDARFETADGGSMVAVHPTDACNLTVVVQADAYPITVSWNIGTGTYALSATGTSMSGEGSVRINNGSQSRFGITLSGASSTLPKEFALDQNYPNPFNPSTSLHYALPVDSRITMDVFNTLGQRVRTLVNDNIAAGYHTIEWNGTGNNGQQLSSGVYFVQMSALGVNGKSFSDLRKLMLLK